MWKDVCLHRIIYFELALDMYWALRFMNHFLRSIQSLPGNLCPWPTPHRRGSQKKLNCGVVIPMKTEGHTARTWRKLLPLTCQLLHIQWLFQKPRGIFACVCERERKQESAYALNSHLPLGCSAASLQFSRYDITWNNMDEPGWLPFIY